MSTEKTWQASLALLLVMVFSTSIVICGFLALIFDPITMLRFALISLVGMITTVYWWYGQS